MATVRRVATAAARKIGVSSEGQPTLQPYDMDVGLEILSGIYDHMMATGDFGRLTDVKVEADYTAKEFERITNTTATDVTITLPATIEDVCVEGDERIPYDLCPVVVVDPTTGVPSNYIYDAIVGDWVALFDLTLDSEAPLSTRGMDNLACVLAAAWADERGGQVGELTRARAATFFSTIRQRNGSDRRPAGDAAAFM